MIELTYWNINDENKNISKEKYIRFLNQYYKNEIETQLRLERIKWYNKCQGYKILLALSEGEIVGQTSAYQCSIIINGKEDKWWWSVDTFVLPKMRGKGVGKKLQNKLHQDLPNFSSLWYSPSNGIIKKKCGAKEITSIDFTYYPVCNYFSFLFNVIIKKIFKIELNITNKKHYFYYYLNRNITNNYTIKEIDFPNPKYERFVEECLKQYDIYIKRDSDYLSWKYLDNPTLYYKSIAIYNKKGNKLIGIVVFSETFNKQLFGKKMNVISILDTFVYPNVQLSYREIICLVIRFYKNRNIKFDGIVSLKNTNYFPKFKYPLKGTPLLSTNTSICRNPYFGYSDQDLEQMI